MTVRTDCRPAGKRPWVRGLSLVEVMVAAALVAIIFTGALMLFRSATSSWSKGEDQVERAQHIRLIGERIGTQISSAYWKREGGIHLKGSADALFFVSSSGDLVFGGDLVEVGYWLEPNGDLLTYVESNPDFDFETGNPESLLKAIGSLSFSYYDGEAWLEEWDTEIKHAMPRAVRVRVSLEDSPEEVFETMAFVNTAR
ncbi:MAG: prepilin-type N-terminal cleavage/methylation domain-containing protein [Candidatus Omnitrophica bacterium]|nr:prepilin-type N-terminal cleavage/methylation domain-containing protein [Candidatus Omnitrophota bacterium]